TLYFWNFGYEGTSNLTYDIVSASVVPTVPTAKGTVIQSYAYDPSDPVNAVTFDSNYLYQAATAAVFRKKLDQSDGTGRGTKLFTLDNTLLWYNIAISNSVAYVTGETQVSASNPVPKATIFQIALPVVNPSTKPTVIPGLDALPRPARGLTVV